MGIPWPRRPSSSRSRWGPPCRVHQAFARGPGHARAHVLLGDLHAPQRRPDRNALPFLRHGRARHAVSVWLPFGVAVVYVVVHHGLFGALDPTSVFNHPAGIANPWKWALVHGLFISAESVVCLIAWRLNEIAIGGERAALAWNCSARTKTWPRRRASRASGAMTGTPPPATWSGRASSTGSSASIRASTNRSSRRPLVEPAGTAVAKAIVQLGSTLRLQTIAEGIEQAELQDSLLGMGCEIGQGFLFSPPLELSLVRERLMAEGSTGLRVVSSARPARREGLLHATRT